MQCLAGPDALVRGAEVASARSQSYKAHTVMLIEA